MSTAEPHGAGGSAVRRGCAALAALALAGCAAVEPPPRGGPAHDALEVDSSVLAFAFSHDGRWFAHLSKNGTLQLRDLLRDEELARRSFGVGASALAVGAADRIAVAGPDGIRIWDALADRVTLIPPPVGPIGFVRFDETARRLAVATEDGSLTIHDAASGAVLERSVPEPLGGGARLAPGAGFGVLYALGPEKVRLLGLGPGAPDVTLRVPRDPDVPLATSADGAWLASLARNGAVEIRRIPAGVMVATLDGFAARPRALALSPDGSVLAAAAGAHVEVWDVRQGQRLDRFGSTMWPAGGIAFSPDGSVAVWVEDNRKTLRLWALARGLVQWTERGPIVSDTARPFCADLAALIRFRLAAAPFERGSRLLEQGDLVAAIAAFAEAEHVLPTYPGLAAAAAEARGRQSARLRAAEVEKALRELEQSKRYAEALQTVERFLQEHARYGDFGLAAEAAELRSALQHLRAAESALAEGRRLDALDAFEKAVAVRPVVRERHPEYAELREQLTSELTAGVDGAFQAGDHARVVALYTDLQRLRPLDSKDLLRSGLAYERLGRRREAATAFAAVAAKAAEYPRARQSLARLARAAGDLEKARAELSLARQAAPHDVVLETELAEVCALLRDFDAAVAAWTRVAELDFDNPAPLETIALLETERGEHARAGEAYRKAIRRSERPRPELLMRAAEAFQKAGEPQAVLAACIDLLQLVDSGVPAPWLGDEPRERVLQWIRALGYVRHRHEWISHEQFFAEQGWIRHGERWLRPEEAQLATIAERLERQASPELRTLAEERYRDAASQKGLLKGMNRREVIRAWGFFADQNELEVPATRTTYEQLRFADGRQVYLRNGLVCFWSE